MHCAPVHIPCQKCGCVYTYEWLAGLFALADGSADFLGQNRLVYKHIKLKKCYIIKRKEYDTRFVSLDWSALHDAVAK